jgi:hypothetical protein
LIDVEASKVATTNNSDANLVCHGSADAKSRQIGKLDRPMFYRDLL